MGCGGAPPPNIALKRHTDLYTYIIVSDPAFMQIHVMLHSDRNAASPRKLLYRFGIVMGDPVAGDLKR